MKLKRRENMKWEENEYAFLIYCHRKGIRTKDIAEIMETAPTQISHRLRMVRYPELVSAKIQKKINKGEILAVEINGGDYPDHKALWDEKIFKVTGLKFTQKEPEEPEEAVEEETEEEIEAPEPLPTATLFQFTVNLDTLKKIVEIVKCN